MLTIQVETRDGKNWAYGNVNTYRKTDSHWILIFAENDPHDLREVFINVNDIVLFEVLNDRGTPVNE